MPVSVMYEKYEVDREAFISYVSPLNGTKVVEEEKVRVIET